MKLATQCLRRRMVQIQWIIPEIVLNRRMLGFLRKTLNIQNVTSLNKTEKTFILIWIISSLIEVMSLSWGLQNRLDFENQTAVLPKPMQPWLDQQLECTKGIMLTTQRWSRNHLRIFMYHSVACHYDWSPTKIHGTIIMGRICGERRSCEVDI